MEWLLLFLFAHTTARTGERRSFDQLETSNTIPLLNASADMSSAHVRRQEGRVGNAGPALNPPYLSLQRKGDRSLREGRLYFRNVATREIVSLAARFVGHGLALFITD